MLCVVALGCSLDEPPGVRQLGCRLAQGQGGGAPSSVRLLVDSGRGEVTFVTLAGRPRLKAEIEPYAYRFDLPESLGGGRAEVDRQDGTMKIAPFKGRKPQDAVQRSGSCKAETREPKL
ncbi:MAG: hypothetical protein JOZ90_05300 [Alphaproteobacteria bacterium]|nr:hypothetical protein [Alphaproteobacteria bacterium]MBV9372807.1 hypothetical protein [Alphaproteobacteria bacterium]MBV9900498.1 hypothetical protein [Alphaproteobacteria bacterium]